MTEHATTGLTSLDNLMGSLRQAGADTDETGKLLVRGDIATGLDRTEILIGPTAQYRRDGLWYPVRCTMVVACHVIF